MFTDRRDLALVMLGSGARGDLCPGSDLDLWIVHRGMKGISQLAESLWYPLWDAGFSLGHAVRTTKEALKLAADDLDTATSLLSLEVLSGDVVLGTELAEAGRVQFVRLGSKWAAELVAATRERHERAGEVAFLLEPDLKEGAGGLRDLATLGWLDATTPGGFGPRPVDLAPAREVLLGVRAELHRVAMAGGSGKATDRLSLQDQAAVAAAMGVATAEELMHSVAAAARLVSWQLDGALFQASRSGSGGRAYQAGWGLSVVGGEVGFDGDITALADPTFACRAADVVARSGVRFAPSLLEALRDRWDGPGDKWTPETQRAFVRLLALGFAALPAWEALDQFGVLARMLPEWAAVRSRVQRNPYHRFTVDRHLVETAFEAARLTGRVSRPDLLLIGALLHDIGKGYTVLPGEEGETDHTRAGLPIARRMTERMGFAVDDVESIASMMEHHLLLPDVATRRDLDDPATVTTVAGAVGSLERLELLDALTEADSLATGPSAWSPWKARLVADLVARTRAELAGVDPGARRQLDPTYPDEAALGVLTEARAAHRLVVHGAADVVRIAAPDRSGLLAAIAGVCAVHGVAILRARVWTSDDGWAVDELVIDRGTGREPDWSRVENDIIAVGEGRFDTAARLAQRERDYAPVTAAGVTDAVAPVEPSVTFQPDSASERATVVEVRAPDRMGLLSTVSGALSSVGCNIVSATVASIGGGVVDTFYVQAPEAAKLDAEHQRIAALAVLEALA